MVLGIYGSGGSGREAREVADLLGTWEEIVFIDDMAETGMYKGLKRMPFEVFNQTYDKDIAEVIIAVGEPEYRISLYDRVEKKGYRFANVIHPNAWISPSATIGRGIIAKSGVLISSDAKIEDNVGFEAYAVVGHDCVVRKGCQISTNVAMGGGSEIGAGCYIGMNVAIKEKVKIGSNSVVGMGSAVQREIPENVIAMGNPARPMKHKDESKVFG